MLTEFNQAVLLQWRSEKVKFLITEEITCTGQTGDLAEFMIYPVNSVEELQNLMLHKTRGLSFDQLQTIAPYDINNPEVMELAEGIPYCRFYLQSQSLRSAA